MRLFKNIAVAVLCAVMLCSCSGQAENQGMGLTADEEQAIISTAENIQQAYQCYSLFISGPVETDAPPLSAENNPYPQTIYYPLDGEYATMDSIKEYFLKYYSGEFFEKYVLSKLKSDDETAPYLLNIDGRLYCNLGYGVGETPVNELDTIKIASYTGDTAQFEIYRHHPSDQNVRELYRINLVKENGRWVYSDELWW